MNDFIIICFVTTSLVATLFVIYKLMLFRKRGGFRDDLIIKDVNIKMFFCYSLVHSFCIIAYHIVLITYFILYRRISVFALSYYLFFSELSILPYCAVFIKIIKSIADNKWFNVSVFAAIWGVSILIIFLSFDIPNIITFLISCVAFLIVSFYNGFILSAISSIFKTESPVICKLLMKDMVCIVTLISLLSTMAMVITFHLDKPYSIFFTLGIMSLLTPLYIMKRLSTVDYQKINAIKMDSNKGLRMNELVIPEDFANSTIHRRLLNLFIVDKIFLSPTITLSDVASELLINKAYLSKILHDDLKRNFRDILNYYRIKEAIEIFSRDNDITLQDLCSQSGFKNNASFINAFKLNTGTTPSEWCKTYKNTN